jgi:hypothetical protein
VIKDSDSRQNRNTKAASKRVRWMPPDPLEHLCWLRPDWQPLFRRYAAAHGEQAFRELYERHDGESTACIRDAAKAIGEPLGWLVEKYPTIDPAWRNGNYFRCGILDMCVSRHPELHQRLDRTRGWVLSGNSHALAASGWHDDNEPTLAQMEAYVAHLECAAEPRRAWYLEHKRPWSEMPKQPAAEPAPAPRPDPEPEPAPEPAAESEPVTLDRGPTGPVLQAAAREQSWYVARIMREPGKPKLRKIPLDGAGRYVDVQIAAVLTLAQALHRLDRMAAAGAWVALGYLPRPNSILIAGDLDNSLAPPWEDDQQPTIAIARQVLAETHAYAERSIGGTGIRLLMKRDSQTPLVTVEDGDAGLFADGKRGVVLTLDPLPGRSREVITDGRVAYLIMQHIEQVRRARRAAAYRDRDHDGPRQSGYHFFDELDPDQQLEELPKMLAVLPEGAFAERGDGSDPMQWISVLMSVKHHFDEDGYEDFDAWSRDRAGGNYDEADNRRTRDSISHANAEGRSRTIASLIWTARKFGYQPPPGATQPPPPRLDTDELARICRLAEAADARERARQRARS